MEIVRKNSSGVAIDWVTGWSCYHEGDGSLYSQAHVFSTASFKRSRPGSWVLKKCCGKRVQVAAPECTLEPETRRPQACIRWTTKGQCSFGDSCAFKHEPDMNVEGKGRPRSPSPTGSPHRNSKRDGKSGDDGSTKGTPKHTGKSPSGKTNKLSCINFKKESCQKGNFCNYWHFLNVQTSKIQPEASSETNASTNTQLTLLITRTFQQLLHFASDERQMKLRNLQSQDKTQFRLRQNHLANRYVLKRENLGPTLGVTQTGCKNQRNPNVPTLREMAKKSAWILHKNVYKIPGLYPENQHRLFKPSHANNVSSRPMRTPKVDSRVSLHMMSKSDLTPQEQDTIRKSKVPSVS